MKKIFIFICFFLATGLLNARTIDEQTALKVASNYYYSRSNSIDFKLSMTHKEVHSNDTALYYIFNAENNKGWVIVSATDATYPILGFSSKSNFPVAEYQAPALVFWMNKYKKQVLAVQRQNLAPTDDITNEWQNLLNESRLEIVRATTVVEPLLETTWGQGLYYNDWCPGGCSTGCVATAMAQIMKYWEEPVHGNGDHCYTPPGYDELCADFENTYYNWDAMPDQVTSYNTPVATLMYHCGVSVNMNYCISGTESGAIVLAIDAGYYYYCSENAYVDYFGYDGNTIEGVVRGSYSDSYWINSVLKPELDAGRPIQYVGDDNENGGSHTWVCDGYNAQNMFHMNWGWDGYGDGDYNINNLTVGGYTFDDYERVLIGIQPATVALSNDNPCDAIQLSVTENCEFTEGTNVGATNSSVSNVYCDGTSNGDVWFKCTVPSSGSLTITTDEGSIVDMGMALYSGTCNNLNYIGCYANGSSYSQYMPTASLDNRTPGEIIWIRLWEYNNNQFGTFSICAFGNGGSSNVEIELSDSEISDDLLGESDGDGDGQCEPGEIIELSIELFNSGTDPANDIEAQLSSNDPDVTITDELISISTLDPGEYDWISDFDFIVSSSCPEKDVIFNLSISSAEGNWDEIITVHIYGSANYPVANFSGTPLTGSSPLTVYFTDLSTNATSWFWVFGDGSTSTVQNPDHTYVSDGTYSVSLTVQNSEGADTETKIGYIIITETGNLPIADFNGTPLTGSSPLTVYFTDLSINATSWFWDFGDGYTSNIQDPDHTYTLNGIYNVSLTAQNSEGSDTETKTGYIIVTEAGNLPIADFYADFTSGNAPLYVVFHNTAINEDTWLWDFGDGSTSHFPHPVHTYSEPGYYTVSLTVTNEFGSDTEIKENFVHATEQGNAPITNFTCNMLNGQVPLNVNFTDLSAYSPTSWNWDFGDGSESNLKNPSHLYQYQGTFSVTLTTSNAFGSDSETKVNYITVTDNSPNPSMGCSNSEGPCPLTINFEDHSSNSPTAWYWNFGDGFTSTMQNPQHTYTSPGTYTVIFTVSNQYGSNTITATDFIHAFSGPLPIADFNCDKFTGPNPLTVKFTNLSTSSDEWEWQFGDGNISFLKDPVYTYSSPGYYTVFLMARNQTGMDTEIKENYIHVISGELLPVADFNANETYGSKPLTVNFNDYSQNATSWTWQFGDGNMSTSQNPIYTYSNTGDYTVSLKVNNQFGEDILTKTNYIHVIEGNPNGYEESNGENKYSLIPNPSNGIFSVNNNTNERGESTYSVYSIAGRNLINGILKISDKNDLDLSILKPGVYIFVIKTGENIYNTKLIID